MAEVQWYYARNDQQFGPVSASELKQMAEAGRLTPNDLLWREGMEAWTTAINMRGLFSEDSSGSGLKAVAGAAVAQAADITNTTVRSLANARNAPIGSASLHRVLRATQMLLWIICVLVVLAGVGLLTRAFLNAKDPGEEAAAGAVYSTFFIAAYVLARCGEKMSRLLMRIARRR